MDKKQTTHEVLASTKEASRRILVFLKQNYPELLPSFNCWLEVHNFLEKLAIEEYKDDLKKRDLDLELILDKFIFSNSPLPIDAILKSQIKSLKSKLYQLNQGNFYFCEIPISTLVCFLLFFS